MTRTLAIVRTRAELDALHKAANTRGVHPRVITLTAGLRLDGGSSADFEMASDLLTPQDIRTIRIEAREAAGSWYAPLGGLLEHRDVDLGSVSAIEQLWFFREVLASATVASRLLASEDFSELYVFSNDAPCLDGHRLLGTHGVTQAVIASIFSANGCRVIDLAERARDPHGRVPRAARTLLRAVRRLRVGAAARRRSRDLDRLASTVSGSIVGFGEDFDLATIAAFLDAAGDHAVADASLIRTTSMTPNVGGRTGLGDRLDRGIFDLYDALSPPGRRVTARLAEARRLLDTMRADGSVTPAELGAPGLTPHLDHVWRRWVQWLVPHISAVDTLLKSRRPATVVLASAERARDRATAEVARNHGIRTLTIPHGYIGDVDAYDFNTDHFAAWGDGSKDVLTSELGKQPETIHVVGAPQFRGLEPVKSGSSAQGSRLVLITSRVTPACYDALDWKEYLATWDAIERFIREHEDVSLVIKPHPGVTEPLSFYMDIVERLGARACVERTQPLEKVVAESDAVACVIDPTTALLVCQLLSIPSVYIRTGWRVRPWAAHAWGLPHGMESVDATSDLASVLSRLLWDEDFRRSCQSRGRALIEKQLKVGTTRSELGDCLGTAGSST